MINKKGYITSTVALSILLTTLALLAVFYSAIKQHNLQIKSGDPPIVQTIDNRNAHERLYSLLSQNMYHSETIVFEDLGLSYEIEEITNEYPVRIIKLTEIKEEERSQTMEVRMTEHTAGGSIQFDIKNIEEGG